MSILLFEFFGLYLNYLINRVQYIWTILKKEDELLLSQRLRQARNAKGYTQKDLADLVNTKKTTISNYETGYSTPSNEMLKDLADVLNTTTDYLLGRVDDPDFYADKESFLKAVREKGLDYSGLTEEEIKMFKEFIENYKKNKNKD